MKGLTDKNVLVTGGSSGIGQAIATRFGHEGANVAINYRSKFNEAQETEAMIRAVQPREVQVALVQGDVSKEEDVVRCLPPKNFWQLLIAVEGGVYDVY